MTLLKRRWVAETERAETRGVGAVTLWSLRHCQAEYIRERERERERERF